MTVNDYTVVVGCTDIYKEEQLPTSTSNVLNEAPETISCTWVADGGLYSFLSYEGMGCIVIKLKKYLVIPSPSDDFDRATGED